MDMDTMKDYIEDLLQERKDLWERVNTMTVDRDRWRKHADDMFKCNDILAAIHTTEDDIAFIYEAKTAYMMAVTGE